MTPVPSACASNFSATLTERQLSPPRSTMGVAVVQREIQSRSSISSDSPAASTSRCPLLSEGKRSFASGSNANQCFWLLVLVERIAAGLLHGCSQVLGI